MQWFIEANCDFSVVFPKGHINYLLLSFFPYSPVFYKFAWQVLAQEIDFIILLVCLGGDFL